MPGEDKNFRGSLVLDFGIWCCLGENDLQHFTTLTVKKLVAINLDFISS